MPLDDWQFWLVSLVFVTALVIVIKPFLPSRKPRSTRCPSCPATDARPKATSITIEGKRPE
ncbi:MAG: hypothetical protein EXS00_03295 [Phycisphaerales bacterium]|nr:hypothetical protein [Phycisphaerales bacterium]